MNTIKKTCGKSESRLADVNDTAELAQVLLDSQWNEVPETIPCSDSDSLVVDFLEHIGTGDYSVFGSEAPENRKRLLQANPWMTKLQKNTRAAKKPKKLTFGA